MDDGYDKDGYAYSFMFILDHYRWYDMKESRQGERVLGRMPSKRRGAVLRLKNHLLIQCQSIDRLYVGQRRLLL